MRALIALEELRNFSLAAERCNVTQSALSQQVRKLEDDVGLQLVDRTRRQVSFTPEGLRFIASAKRMMQELDEIDIDLKDHASGKRGRVNIAALPSIAAHWLPRILAKYQLEFPAIELGLFDVPAQRALELVRARQVDFAITADGPGRPGLDSRLLFKEEFVVVCHRKHELAQASRLTAHDLEGQTYIRLVRTGSIAQYLEPTLRTLKLLESGLEVDQVATVAGLVANNLGISIVPELTVPYFDRRQVIAIPLDFADIYRPIYLVSAGGRTLSTAAREFVAALDHSKWPITPESPPG